jgi:hypothetical protein
MGMRTWTWTWVIWIACGMTAGTAGCSSLDDDVFAEITHAELTVDETAPDAPAAIAIDVTLHGRRTTDRDVVLEGVWLTNLTDGEHLIDLEMAMPPGADLHIDEYEDVDVTLVNEGTTNGELAPFCGSSLRLAMQISYVDEPEAATFGYAEVIVACE